MAQMPGTIVNGFKVVQINLNKKKVQYRLIGVIVKLKTTSLL